MYMKVCESVRWKRRGGFQGGSKLEQRCALLCLSDILSLFCSCKFSLGSKINVKIGGNSKGTLKVRASSTGCLGPNREGLWS